MSHDLFSAILAAFALALFGAVWTYVYSSAADQPAVRAVLSLGLSELRLVRAAAAAHRRHVARRRTLAELQRRHGVRRHRPVPGRPPARSHAWPVYADAGDDTVITRAFPGARHVRQEVAPEIVPVVTEGGRRIAAVLAHFDATPPRRRRRPADEDTVVVARAEWYADVHVGSAGVAA
jgi:hypothetical protein